MPIIFTPSRVVKPLSAFGSNESSELYNTISAQPFGPLPSSLNINDIHSIAAKDDVEYLIVNRAIDNNWMDLLSVMPSLSIFDKILMVERDETELWKVFADNPVLNNILNEKPPLPWPTYLNYITGRRTKNIFEIFFH